MKAASLGQIGGLCGSLMDDLLPEREKLVGKKIHAALNDEKHPFRQSVKDLAMGYFGEVVGQLRFRQITVVSFDTLESKSTTSCFQDPSIISHRQALTELPSVQPGQAERAFMVLESIEEPMNSMEIVQHWCFQGKENISEKQIEERLQSRSTSLQAPENLIWRKVKFKEDVGLGEGSNLFFVPKRSGEVGVLVIHGHGRYRVALQDLKEKARWSAGTRIFWLY